MEQKSKKQRVMKITTPLLLTLIIFNSIAHGAYNKPTVDPIPLPMHVDFRQLFNHSKEVSKIAEELNNLWAHLLTEKNEQTIIAKANTVFTMMDMQINKRYAKPQVFASEDDQLSANKVCDLKPKFNTQFPDLKKDTLELFINAYRASKEGISLKKVLKEVDEYLEIPLKEE